MVERLFLAVPWGCLRFVIVVLADHTHLLFLTNLSYHRDVLTNLGERFDEFGGVLTWGRFDCNPSFWVQHFQRGWIQ